MITRLPPGITLIDLDTVGSTNDEARQRAEAGADAWTVVRARIQDGGRGRRGRDWASPAGNLYMSVILRPDCAPERAAGLSFVVALAVSDALASALPPMAELTLKWPNDVLVNDRKIAGILLESANRPDGAVDWLIAGIGINIVSHPESAAYDATDLHFEGAVDANPDTVMSALARGLMLWTDRWRADGFAPIRRAWLARARGLGAPIEVRLERETLRGTFADLDESGALVIDMAGERRLITAGDVFPAEGIMTDKGLLLAIDSGNTNVVFGLFDGDRLIHRWRTTTDERRTADEYAVWLTQLMALVDVAPRAIGGAAIANVVPLALHHLEALCRRYFDCEPLVVDYHLDLGIEIRLDRPAQVGADRLVNAVAAHRALEGWLIVIDFGTATTFDVVAPDGGYHGGIIAPGVNLSIEALERAAARLPRIRVARPPQVVGKGTIDAMQSGVYWGYTGLIEGLVVRVKAELGAPATVVATGGLAPIFNDATDVIDRLEPDLTLTGLRLVHDDHRADG